LFDFRLFSVSFFGISWLGSYEENKEDVTLSIYDLDNQNHQQLFELPRNDIFYVKGLSWSPDGKYLIFSLQFETPDQGVQSDVFIYNLDDGLLSRVTKTSDNNERSPAWYPKETIFTYTSTPNLNEYVDARLVFTTPDGLCKKVFAGLEGIGFPSWSPDGEQLAFLSSDGIEILDVSEVIPAEFLSPDALCDQGE
jgi:Tol biopolymer transport system component